MLKRVWPGPGSWGWPWSLIPWVARTHFGSSLECGVIGWGWDFPLFLKRIISVSWPFLTWNLWSLTLPWFLPDEDRTHVERFPSLWDGQEEKMRTHFLMKSVRVHSTGALPQQLTRQVVANRADQYAPGVHPGKVSMWTLSRCLQRLRCFWQAWWPLNHTGPLWQLLGLLVFTYRCALKGLSGTVRSVHGQLPLFPPSSAHSGSSVPETSKEHRFFLFIRLVVTRSELHCMQGNCTQCALNQAWLIAGTQ